uniref:Androgen-induced gene 1 protein n=1 Tax=Romanomermis culicivorax TaxID=13658 RepID=A0A915KDI2_ROMCU
MIRTLIYLVIFVTWLRTLVYDVLYVGVVFDGEASWFTKLKFLTILNMVLQTGYFGLCTLRALIDRCQETPKRGPHRAHPELPTYYPTTKLHVFCDRLYALAVFPLGMIVCIVFWSLYAVDREMIFPKELDAFIPRWMNHVLHTAPVPFILVDTMLVCHKYPSAWEGFRASIALGLIYTMSLYVWNYFDGYWVYPFMDTMSDGIRFIFLVFAPICFAVFYFIGDHFNRLLWGGGVHPVREVMKRRLSKAADLKKNR